MVSDRRSFGERLKRHRERCGVTLQEISRSSKIAVSLFDGLERGDCARWPAGIYGRAYIRAYADAIGIDADEAVHDFARLFNGPTTTDRGEAAAVQSPRRAGALRLSMVAEPVVTPGRVAHRAALAGADLVIGILLASIAHVGFGASVWITVAVALAYHAAGRVVSDEPLLYWIFQRVHTARLRPAPAAESEVTVGETASTTA